MRCAATCEEAGIDTSCILYDDNAASGCSVIILEEQPNGGTENRILVVPGANMTITPEDVAFLKDRIAEFDLVVLQLEIPMGDQHRSLQNMPTIRACPSC